MYHKPVLLKEAIDALVTRLDGVYADVTFGGGGHSRELLGRLSGVSRLIALDRDADAAQNEIKDDRFVFVLGNFSNLKNYCYAHGTGKLSGILADLGVSSHQFDTQERGFSTRLDARLDMRMNVKSEQDAYEIINHYSAEQLSQIFFKYGEIENAARLAQLIVFERVKSAITTTGDLKVLASSLARRGKEAQYNAQVFQALRIEVNKELEALESFLRQSAELIAPGGRLVVISYHSLEDRLVKQFINKGKFTGEVEKDLFGNELKPFRSVHRKSITPSLKEISENRRARSAKMRVAEKLETP